MTKTKTLKIAAAFSLAVLLGTSLFASSESVKSSKLSTGKNVITDLINHTKLSVKAYPSG